MFCDVLAFVTAQSNSTYSHVGAGRESKPGISDQPELTHLKCRKQFALRVLAKRRRDSVLPSLPLYCSTDIPAGITHLGTFKKSMCNRKLRMS